MASWNLLLDRLKRDAYAQTEEDPTPSAEAMAIAEEVLDQPISSAIPLLREAVQHGIDVGLKPAPTCTTYGWLLCLSRTRFPNGRYSWHLSASLVPKGRSSSPKDWNMLGRFVAYLGGPQEAVVFPENPNDVHHLSWFEPEPS